jgi:hypothetical protein
MLEGGSSQAKFGRSSIKNDGLKASKAFEDVEIRDFYQVFRFGEMIIFPSLCTMRQSTPSSF